MENNLETKKGSPLEAIYKAITEKADLEKLEKLLILQRDFEAHEAKKAFVRAMTAFKAEAPQVTKDKENKQYNSKYTSLPNLVNTVNPVLSKHGLSASWDIEQNGTIKVTCRITHELGHSETASASAPADKSGAKNEVQQIKSTITYLKAVTFESICGLASSEANLDDDGSAMTDYISQEQVSNLIDLVTNLKDNYKVEFSEKGFCSYLGIESLEKMPKTKYQQAIVALQEKEKALKAKVKK